MTKARDRYKALAAALNSSNTFALGQGMDWIITAIVEQSTEPPWDCTCCLKWRDSTRDRALTYMNTDLSEWDHIHFDTQNPMPAHLRRWITDGT